MGVLHDNLDRVRIIRLSCSRRSSLQGPRARTHCQKDEEKMNVKMLAMSRCLRNWATGGKVCFIPRRQVARRLAYWLAVILEEKGLGY